MTRRPSGRDEWIGIAADAVLAMTCGILVVLIGRGPAWSGLMTTIIVYQGLRSGLR